MLKHFSSKITLVLFAFLVCNNAKAQILLHEATDITQTKATLSADFIDCEGYSSKYFLYKAGTFPEIDDFSELALDSLSDRFQLTSTGKAWSARTVKGWLESNKELSVGQKSTMSASITIYQSSAVSFEWSVDSEENYGVLSFVVDGTTVKEISGYVDFAKVTHALAPGAHTLQWIYTKKSASNVGLDLGMVRNINVQNTTPGIWKNVACDDSSVRLSDLHPGMNYLFKGGAGSGEVVIKKDPVIVNSAQRSASTEKPLHIVSPIKTFTTKAISVGDVAVDTTTQTTATISSPIDLGDAEATATIKVSKDWKEWSSNTLFKAGFLEKSYPCKIISSTKWSYYYTYSHIYQSTYVDAYPFEIEVYLPNSATLSFDWYISSLSYKAQLMIDGELITNARKTTWETFSCELSAGKHTISWLKSSVHVGLYIRNININVTDSNNHTLIHTSPTSIVSGLLPNQSYRGELLLVNDKAPFDTLYHNEGWKFSTCSPIAQTDSCTDLMQTSVMLRGYVDGGDANTIAVGLQHKDKTGTRWADYPLNAQDKSLEYRVARLKPNTQYDYRSYIHVEGCDTVFSPTASFTTLAVVPHKPKTSKLTQHTAIIEGYIDSGDASIYQRGMQFRKKGDAEWETYEDGGNDSIFSLTKKNLDLGAQYEARTYVEPAGGEMIYSDILLFATKYSYFSMVWSESTQTSITFLADFCERDDDTVIEECGFEYSTAENDYQNPDSVLVVPDSIGISFTIKDLMPGTYFRYIPYVKIDGEKIYNKAYDGNNWSYGHTQGAYICTSTDDITQTTATLRLDSIPQSEVSISQIEYAIVQGVYDPDTLSYHKLNAEVKLENLKPDTHYNIIYRGLVNGRLRRLEALKDSGCFIRTKPMSAGLTFTNITQTKATMTLNVNAGDAEVSDLQFTCTKQEGTSEAITGVLEGTTYTFTGLAPGYVYYLRISGKINGLQYDNLANANFRTMSVSMYETYSKDFQTSANVFWTSEFGDATYRSSGVQYGLSYDLLDMQAEGRDSVCLKDLQPSTQYYYRTYVETEEGGLIYSFTNSLMTSAIVCETLPAGSLSNRSATLNGVIDCDANSAAEFGFIWKQMTGWESEPAFTKGVKADNDSISVALVSGMLEPNTDYQYQAAVRYQGTIYSSGIWETFRTESEFVYYPATVYTVYRTDRENNSIVLCGYFVAGSEEIVSQGYEYWANSKLKATSGNVHRVTTDETMQHIIDISTLSEGIYMVRAFVTTASGETIYGPTKSFVVGNGEVSGFGEIEVEPDTEVIAYYDFDGRKYAEPQKGFNIVLYSDGERRKVFVK